MGQSRETTELQWRFPLFFCWQWLPRLPPRQTPRLRLTLTSCTEDTMATDSATVMDTDTPTTDTTERGRPRLSLRLRLTLTSCTVDTTAMDSAMAMDTDTPTATDTTARGRLRLSPLLLLPSSATPTLPTPMLPLPLSLLPSPSLTRPSPPPWRPMLLLPTLPSLLPLEATRPLPVTTVT